VAYAALQNMPHLEDRIPSVYPDNKMNIFLKNFRTVALGRVIGRGPMSLARFFLNPEVGERKAPWNAAALLPLSPRQPCCPALCVWRFYGWKVAFSLSGSR
jgi:hypothetical protein